jgi:tRNA threonylcarbamoyladenosine biosynthesis protein TsaB
MKYSIYLNTIKGFQLGLLDQDFKWIDFQEENTSKSADIVHKSIYDLLKKNNLKLDKKLSLIYLAGPGSYTGIRVSAGISSIVEIMNGSVLSFPVYLIPFLSEQSVNYNFILPAFKGEHFCYSHQGNSIADGSSQIIDLSNFQSNLPIYTFGEVFQGLKVSDVGNLISNNCSQIFSNAQKLKLNDGPIYFRQPEEEFRNQAQ